MAYKTEDMIQYTVDEAVKVTDLTNLKAKQCGSSGIYILIDHDPDYKYSLLFGDIITHRFKNMKAIREWNNNYNSFVIAIAIGMTLTLIEQEEANGS